MSKRIFLPPEVVQAVVQAVQALNPGLPKDNLGVAVIAVSNGRSPEICSNINPQSFHDLCSWILEHEHVSQVIEHKTREPS